MIKTGKFTEWEKLSGMYFRFPNEDFEDICWDDDYHAGISVKSWFKKKYMGPYYYGGKSEYFYQCQKEIKNLIERLPLYDVLLMPGMEQNFDSWSLSNEKAWEDANNEIRCLAPVTMPILNAICYRYDYGDNWSVRITATSCYDTKQTYEASGNPITPIEEHRPVCVDADALPLCDDVGGIHGFCDMLAVLHGNDPEEKESMKEWARYMGWTGRMVKPENIL